MGTFHSAESNRSGIDETQTALTRARYDRRAKDYDRTIATVERLFLSKRRASQWSLAAGERILEVGVGTGLNFPHYPAGAAVTAVDLSEKMLEVARQKALANGIKVDLRQMDAQRLEFPDDYFDCVLATCVFCSVPDPVLGLSEVARVCKPDGKVVLLEHVRSETPLGYLMDLVNPLVVRMSGANINRRTMDNIRRAGLAVERVDSFYLDVVKLVVARPRRIPA